MKNAFQIEVVQGFLMDNTSEAILRLAECSVLAIKPPGFENFISAWEGI